jgi:hypothetical protein
MIRRLILVIRLAMCGDLQRLADAFWQRPRWTEADECLSERLNAARIQPPRAPPGTDDLHQAPALGRSRARRCSGYGGVLAMFWQ